MTPNEQRMWHDIAEVIEPYCVNGAGFIKDYFDDPICEGFTITAPIAEPSQLKITCYLEGPLQEYFRIEEDLRIFYKDKPGTFEGLPNDSNS